MIKIQIIYSQNLVYLNYFPIFFINFNKVFFISLFDSLILKSCFLFWVLHYQFIYTANFLIIIIIAMIILIILIVAGFFAASAVILTIIMIIFIIGSIITIENCDQV